MKQLLWINRWNDKRKLSAIEKHKTGIDFISKYQMTNFKTVLRDLWFGLVVNKGSINSGYVSFIPPNGKEVIKVRLSDHPSSKEEWQPNELTGLPNRRYSIVIFSHKSMPTESNQKVKELNWKSYKAQNIPVYEKTFNRYYLKETFPKLISILKDIYNGNSPEDKSLPINIIESKNNKTNENRNMKKTIRLTESDLKRMIKSCLLEYRYMSDNDIVNQYSDMEIISFNLEPLSHGDGWKGAFELNFPNADNVDYDNSMVNNFIVYDQQGKRIAWDNWMPNEQTHKLESIIRAEIANKTQQNDLDESIHRVIRKLLH